MRRTELRKLEGELHEFLAEMFEGLGRRERLESMSWYVTGLLLDGERKSTEPMAARLVHDADEVSGMRQRLQEGVSVCACTCPSRGVLIARGEKGRRFPRRSRSSGNGRSPCSR